MKTYTEVYDEFAAKQQELKSFFDANVAMENGKPKLDSSGQKMYAMDSGQTEEVRKRNDELSKMGVELDNLRYAQIAASKLDDTMKGMQVPASGIPAMPGAVGQAEGFKTWGDKFTESKTYKSAREGDIRSKFGVDIAESEGDHAVMKMMGRLSAEGQYGAMKTLMETTNGFAPFSPRGPRLIDFAMMKPTLADWIPSDATSYTSVKWMEETSFDNQADTVAEGAAKPESGMEYTERDTPVQKIATWLPVTEEQIMDIPGLRGLIDNRLTLMLRIAEEDQLLNGTGVSPDLQGFLTKTGINTQARGADTNADTLFKLMTKIRYTGDGFAEPWGFVIHPTNWETIRLMKSTTNEYIWGAPSESGIERIWGKPIRQTTRITSGTALTGDFPMFSHISRRLGIRIDISDSHSDYFIKNKLAIRAEMRESLEIYRAAAFGTATSLN